MKILILTVGSVKDQRVASLAGEYLSRIRPRIVDAEHVPDKGGATEERVEREGREILQRLRPNDRVILLAENGASYDSVSFSSFLAREMETSPGRVVLIIGGPWGVSGAVKSRADHLLSLSPMTFPHELCFMFLTEQIYRAFSILQGSKYHH